MAKRKSAKFYSASNIREGDEILVGAFDTETEGLGGNLLMIQWGIFEQIRVETGPDMLDIFLDDISQYPSPVIWYCHFAQYDWRYFMSKFVERQMDVQFHMRSDSAMYQITFKNAKGRKIIMRDSWAIWNSPLEKLAESFCPELPKLKIDIANFDPHDPEHIAYARRDVQILLVGLPRLFAMLKRHFNVAPSGTFSGTALKGWQKTLKADESYAGSQFNARELYIRSAYYGGLVFLTDTNTTKNCETFDVNSSYPSVMDEFGVPSGTCFQTTEFQNDSMAIYTVRVRAPRNLIVPILPARNAAGSMRWFAGEFITTVTNRELIFAINNGYQILEILEGVAWESVAYPFAAIVGLCKTVRNKYKGGPEEYLAKFMQNSIYGKFGSRRERLRVFAAHNATSEDMLGAEPYDDAGQWLLKRELDTEMLVKPEWAAFITAHARLKLLQAVYSIGPENVIYGDTDSITVRAGYSQYLNVGADYGQWKLEKTWREFRAIAPKVYSGILSNGKRYAAAKGLPRKGVSEEAMRELLENGATQATVQSLDSLRVTLRNGVNPSKELTRKSSSLANSINFERLQNGKVRPKIAA